MGQVPVEKFSYLIVGDGRVARSIRHYFSHLKLPFQTYSRRENHPADLEKILQIATHVLFLVKDDQIDAFFRATPAFAQKQCVHFSGVLVHPDIPSAHPLMTFTTDVLSLSFLTEMYFTIEEEGASFQTLLPGVPNRHVSLPRSQKARYHAWCVMSGNFTTMLWEAAAKEFSHRPGLTPQMLAPYLSAISQNLTTSFENYKIDRTPASQLTGPFVRHDSKTIEIHLKILSDDPFRPVYHAFWTAYQHQQLILDAAPKLQMTQAESPNAESLFSQRSLK